MLSLYASEGHRRRGRIGMTTGKITEMTKWTLTSSTLTAYPHTTPLAPLLLRPVASPPLHLLARAYLAMILLVERVYENEESHQVHTSLAEDLRRVCDDTNEEPSVMGRTTPRLTKTLPEPASTRQESTYTSLLPVVYPSGRCAERSSDGGPKSPSRDLPPYAIFLVDNPIYEHLPLCCHFLHLTD